MGSIPKFDIKLFFLKAVPSYVYALKKLFIKLINLYYA